MSVSGAEQKLPIIFGRAGHKVAGWIFVCKAACAIEQLRIHVRQADTSFS